MEVITSSDGPPQSDLAVGPAGRVAAIEPGKYAADLIAVEGDPGSSVMVLQEVSFVMQGGAVLKVPH